MDKLHIPNSEIDLFDGSIVVIERFPGTKWLFKNGKYIYNEEAKEGWYLMCIRSQQILEATDSNLINAKVITGQYDDDDDCVCPPPCPPFPPAPCPHPKPQYRVKSIEKYIPGVTYFEGQLIYLEYGKFYQVLTDFISSCDSESPEEDLQKDYEAGYLLYLKGNEDIIKIAEEVELLSHRVEETATRKYALNFNEAFHTHKPTKSDADTYLKNLTPPVEPGVYIYFRNIDESSTTYNHVFTYYTDSANPNELVFLDDTISVERKIDKVDTAVENDIAIFTADGNIKDSGTKLSDLGVFWEDIE